MPLWLSGTLGQSGVAELLLVAAPVGVDERRHEDGTAGHVLGGLFLASRTGVVAAHDLPREGVGESQLVMVLTDAAVTVVTAGGSLATH